jgi:hypothetical protein
VINNISDLFSGKGGINRNKGRTNLGSGENGKEKLGTVGKKEAYLIAFLNSQAQKAIGRAVNLMGKVNIAKRALIKQKERGFWALFNLLLQKLPEGSC